MDNILAGIVQRIRIYKGLRTEAEVADLLGMHKNALSNRKKRDAIPYEELHTFCLQENLSLDWLLTGKGEGSPVQLTAQSKQSQPLAEHSAITPMGKALIEMFNQLSPNQQGDVLGYVEKLRRGVEESEIMPGNEHLPEWLRSLPSDAIAQIQSAAKALTGKADTNDSSHTDEIKGALGKVKKR